MDRNFKKTILSRTNSFSTWRHCPVVRFILVSLHHQRLLSVAFEPRYALLKTKASACLSSELRNSTRISSAGPWRYCTLSLSLCCPVSYGTVGACTGLWSGCYSSCPLTAAVMHACDGAPSPRVHARLCVEVMFCQLTPLLWRFVNNELEGKWGTWPDSFPPPHTAAIAKQRIHCPNISTREGCWRPDCFIICI